MRSPKLLRSYFAKSLGLAFLILAVCLPGFGYRRHKTASSGYQHASAAKSSGSHRGSHATRSRTTRTSTRASHSRSRRVQTRASQGRRSGRLKHFRGQTNMARAAPRRFRGQQAINEDRTTEIQEALIRSHYLQGQPTGMWDDGTREAMRRYQSDNGWQTKILPDSRALIKMGLGPSHERDINASGALSQGLPRPHSSGNEPEPPDSPQK